MDLEAIYKIVKFIQNSPIKNKDQVFGDKYLNFKTQYPVLFEVACKDEKIDDNMLQMMLNMVSKIKREEITQFDASASVSQVLYDKYVEPVLPPVPEGAVPRTDGFQPTVVVDGEQLKYS
jgi:hypothetical protein